MADKISSSRKRVVSQKRVAVVLASLVGTMTISAGTLLLMEGRAPGTSVTSVPGWAVNESTLAAQLQTSAPLQADAWNYIIIFESGDLTASADSLAEGRDTGGPTHSPKLRPKANFHFVIDSAQSGNGRMDGDLEVQTSWKTQGTGAPYAGWPEPRSYSFTPYNNAVGVCVIGDTSRKSISQAQRQSLLNLVRELQHRLNIRKECVLFQWDANLDAMQATPEQLQFAREFRAALQ
jgi:N-acetylmuramoyl-L-alanine amidase